MAHSRILVKREKERLTKHFHSYLLPHLHHSLPEVFGFHTMAVVTHLVLDDKLDHEHLLQDSTIHHLERKDSNRLHHMLGLSAKQQRNMSVIQRLRLSRRQHSVFPCFHKKKTSDHWDLETVLLRHSNGTNNRAVPRKHEAQVLTEGQRDEMAAPGNTHLSQTHITQSRTEQNASHSNWMHAILWHYYYSIHIKQRAYIQTHTVLSGQLPSEKCL